MVAAEERLAIAPAAAAGDDLWHSGSRFGDKIGAVGDELGVETEERAERAIDLFGRVVAGLQAADGGFDQRVECGDVGICQPSAAMDTSRRIFPSCELLEAEILTPKIPDYGETRLRRRVRECSSQAER